MFDRIAIEFAAARERWLDAATARLEADRRVAAAILTGSFGRRTPDAWSDIDLLVVVGAGHAEVVAEGAAFAGSFGDVLFAFDSPWNAPIDGGQVNVLYDVGTGWPLYVDWDLWPRHRGAITSDVRVLFDRVGLHVVAQPLDEYRDWPRGARPDAMSEFKHRARIAMLPIIAKCLVREETDRAARALANLSGTEPGPTPTEQLAAAHALWAREREHTTSRVQAAFDAMFVVLDERVSGAA